MTGSERSDGRNTESADNGWAGVEASEREQAVHHLREALEADERNQKQFHIRQSLQLLTLAER
jgi:hypothetical protein